MISFSHGTNISYFLHAGEMPHVFLNLWPWLWNKTPKMAHRHTHWAVFSEPEMLSFHMRMSETLSPRTGTSPLCGLFSKSPSGTFLVRCASRFQHKAMFISIILRLLSSKLLLAHSDSRWATSLTLVKRLIILGYDGHQNGDICISEHDSLA